MKQIPLTQGQFALVDDADFDALNVHKWHAQWPTGARSFYAARGPVVVNGKRKKILMHRMILGLTNPKVHGDHINHNTLDNRRENLRTATSSQNGANRRGAASNSKTGIRGVTPIGAKFQARIRVSGKLLYLGTFKTTARASAAYLSANLRYFGAYGGRSGSV